jgi:hypothetical protein
MSDDDNELTLVMMNRKLAFTPDNTVMVSKRAAHISEQHTKQEIQAMLMANAPPDGYTLDELRRIERFMEDPKDARDAARLQM